MSGLVVPRMAHLCLRLASSHQTRRSLILVSIISRNKKGIPTYAVAAGTKENIRGAQRNIIGWKSTPAEA